MQETKHRPFPEMVKDAVLVGLVSTALALPLVGFKTVDRTTQIELENVCGQGFACPRRPHDDRDLPGGDLAGDPVEDRPALERLVQVRDLHHVLAVLARRRRIEVA